MSETTISAKDRNIIRGLAAQWKDHASDPVMAERKRLWQALHDLAPVRPMILFETGSVDGFVMPSELLCEDPFLRAVERNMRETVRHAGEVGDDVVVEPYFRFGWQMALPDFGVNVEQKPALMGDGETSLGYTFNFPIKTPADFDKLRKRAFGVDREKTRRFKGMLEDTMGDILPVRVGNYDPFIGESGDEGFCGNFFFGLTWQLYRLIGNDGLLYWLYDAPETIHKLMAYLRDDKIALFRFMESGGLLDVNTDNQMAGPRAYGYVSELPGAGHTGPLKLKDLWGWAESQESVNISPVMFKEFVLPHIAELSAMFGLVYYGCCEPVHDRLALIMEAIPNLRSVSVSGWSDFEKVAEMLGKRYVFSRKPTPALLSGAHPLWDLAREDMEKTYAVTKGCNVEILFRDLYTVDHERSRIAEWVRMTRSVFGI
ncbi:MAG: hypothetical protein NT154_43900 [Verrucomicrobia bacterium]|nr:hypothetical protein [Verrucomicrobiota bacterium]